MESRPIPYKKTVFVCTNARADGRAACANPGKDGLKILEALKAAVKAAGLKGQVRVARSGCLDLCEKGPNLFFHPSGEWVCGANLADVPKLIKLIVE